MAAIDKTYTSDYEEYQKFLKWAKNTTFKCPNGIRLYVYDYVYDYWTEEDMKESERPVMNSSWTLDYFLIKNCPFKFVQDRMREVYDNEFIESVLNGSSEYDKFKYPKVGTKFVITRGKCMNHKNYLWKLKGRKIKFEVEVVYNNSYLWYNSEIKRFILPYELGEGDTHSWMSIGYTVKSLIRNLRELRLPKGSIVMALGRYKNESLIISVR